MTDTTQMRPLIKGGYQLIPLYEWDRVINHKGKAREMGKAPRDKTWTTRPYDNEKVVEEARRMDGGARLRTGNNVGVRLTAKDLVLDIDPRNIDGGLTAAKRQLRKLGVDIRKFPCVTTGSGGLHVYTYKNPDDPVMDRLPDWPGIELKTIGRQVVAPGSRHPNGNTYEWAQTDFDPDDLWLGAPHAPDRLLRAAKRRTSKPHSQGRGGQGEHPCDEIGTILGHLSVEDFRDHDRWLQLMMAVHHASAGLACEEFVEWCEGDPLYASDGEEIRYRWASLRRHGIGLGTLYKLMREQGCSHLIERRARVVPHDEFGEAV